MQVKTKAVVLGAGMVGSVIAKDLASDKNFEVTVVDLSPPNLDKIKNIKTIAADLSDTNVVKKLVSECDIVLGALPSVIGFQTLQAVIEAKKNYCDISFMNEDPLELDALAKKNGVTAVVDCGVAPGMSNMLVGYAHSQLDKTSEVEIYVGGLPRKPSWPFEYRAGFSPYDVIQEYTRPSRLVENGKVVVREALSEPELMEFSSVGTLEAFNTDGLRTLLHTIDAPSKKEKTLRYPGHIELMRVLRHMGLFDHKPIKVGKDKTLIRPIDVTASLLFPKWTYEPNEADLTVMRIIVKGEKDKKPAKYEWDLLDFFDEETKNTSMSRTTGYPCSIIARLIADKTFNKPGINPPEFIGQQPGMLDRVLNELQRRKIIFTAKGSEVVQSAQEMVQK